MKYTHDAIVIGGGAAGLTAAGGCALFGLEVALIEGGAMGGECLNNGCVPSKALIAAARRAAEAREAERFGVKIAGHSVDWAGVHAHVHGTIAQIAPHDSPETFEEMGCEVILGWAKLTGPHEVYVNGRTLSAPRIVLALGSSPAIPPIEGLDGVPFLTNENLFDLPVQPEHLVIVGGGVIGMEMAQSFCRLGSQVTVINPGELMGRDDRDSVAVVREVMEGEGVRFVNGRAASVAGADGAITLTTDGGEVIAGSHLLIAVGRKARGQGLGLEELGVKFGRNGIIVDNRRRTALKHIYAIGDCREGPRLTHVSGYEGSNAALEIALGVPAKVNWDALPWCTYTSPEIAQIGLTETEARAKLGSKLRVVREDFSHNERAMTQGDTRGHLKVMLKGKKVVGASICGPHAGELLLPFTQLITGSASTFALGSAVVSYPTFSEITKAAGFAVWEPTVFSGAVKAWARFLSRIRRKF